MNQKDVQASVNEALQMVKLASELIAVTYPGDRKAQRYIASLIETAMVKGLKDFIENGVKGVS